jgi:4-alpha-glucanotransferase
VLRIDHVMGVHRLWWVPEGMGATEGADVRHPGEELLAVMATEAARTSTTVIGEDLGTRDMPAFAAAVGSEAAADVAAYRELVSAAVEHPVDDRPADLLDAALERLVSSDAYFVVADLDDLLGTTAPHNVPCVVLEATWRRLPDPASTVVEQTDVRRRIGLLAGRTAGGAA